MPDEETVTVTIDGPQDDVPVTATTDPVDAPWGFKEDGTPYKRDPAIYATRTANKARKSGKAPTGRKASRSKGPDYTQDVTGVLQLAVLPLAVAGRANPVFLLDAHAVTEGTPEIAAAVNEVAQNDPRVAALLDKLGKVGPYGVLVAAVVPVAVQVAVNHRALAPGIMGTQDPDLLLAQLQAEGERLAREQAQVA